MLEERVELAQSGINIQWILFSGVIVFFMQTGFALFEQGSVRHKNHQNVIFKNCFDACVGGILWWMVGFGLAYGDVDGGFFGKKYFFGRGMKEDQQYGNWFFQYAFACTSSTIVSGSAAERIKISAYLGFSALMTGFIYPIVVAWTWGEGWLYDIGYEDFAGSGVVHMTGGFAGLAAAIACGPRLGRFEPIRKNGDVGALQVESNRSNMRVAGGVRFKDFVKADCGYDQVIQKFTSNKWDIVKVHSFSKYYMNRLRDSYLLPYDY
mmetsp:Transcript_4758/g.8144  ORF Transcript_4758/g.8144 Transcript_4758/m.8144 type:complete len:265 (+) Transcript_4758:114-908(+)